jgi:hypothetical protein
MPNGGGPYLLRNEEVVAKVPRAVLHVTLVGVGGEALTEGTCPLGLICAADGSSLLWHRHHLHHTSSAVLPTQGRRGCDLRSHCTTLHDATRRFTTLHHAPLRYTPPPRILCFTRLPWWDMGGGSNPFSSRAFWWRYRTGLWSACAKCRAKRKRAQTTSWRLSVRTCAWCASGFLGRSSTSRR